MLRADLRTLMIVAACVLLGCGGRGPAPDEQRGVGLAGGAAGADGAASGAAGADGAASGAAGADGAPEGEDAAPGDAQLVALLDEVWELEMRAHPTWATYEGDRRFDDRLSDLSPEGRRAYREAMAALAARAEAIDPQALSGPRRDTRAMLLESIAAEQAVEAACRAHAWSIDGLSGPQADYPMMAVFFPIRDQADVERLAARYRATEVHMRQHIANLRRGLADGLVATRANVERAIEQVERVLSRPPDEDPMLALSVVSEGFEPDASALRAALEQAVRPALREYGAFLREEALPAARGDEGVGVGALPQGAACYQAQLVRTLGPGYTPEQLHQVGLEELASAHAGMVEEARALGIEVDSARAAMAAIKARPDAYATSAEALVTHNRALIARAEAAVGQVIGRLPETPVDVRPIEAHRAPDAPAAYYYSADAEGTRPAYYYINTHAPETRPLYNMEALAFHEAVPGHHTQIALAQERDAAHVWRRNAGPTVFVEGWALYAELLGAELGLYSGPMTRFGMHNYQAWRAARLVIDTGLHHQGWSRQRALAFLRDNVLLPESEAANEIDRYIAWPGQALAYMTGRREIERLRREAEVVLGPRFEPRAFHDVVLGSGAVPLTILRAHVAAWIEAEQAR